MSLVLASASPRRREILATLGLEHRVRPAQIDERPRAGELPDDYVLRMAEAKALAISALEPEPFILGADTAVVLDNVHILGKPADEEEARSMLRRLQGRTHEVMSAVALARGGELLEGLVSVTEVRFAPLVEAQIAAYAASGEGLDKAGAYAIQGMASGFVSEILGSYSTVVGLPAERVVSLLLDHDVVEDWPLPRGPR